METGSVARKEVLDETPVNSVEANAGEQEAIRVAYDRLQAEKKEELKRMWADGMISV